MSAYSAKRLPVQLGPAGWNAILGSQGAVRRLDERRNADFVIVGAGFAGLSAARRLTQLQPKARIVVLEAGRVAEGGAGRNSGFMIDLPHHLASDDYSGSGDDRAKIALNRHAIAFARGAVEEYGIDANFFDPVGKVNGAASPAAHAANERYGRYLASLGEASEMLDPRQMHELTGSRHYRSGLYTPGTVMLQPAGYSRGLAARLSERGVDLFEESPVTRFEKKGADWLVSTPQGSVCAPRVLLTVNGHLESFGIERGRLMHLFLFAVMTPELDKSAQTKLGGAARWGITPSDPMGTTVRRIDSGLGGNRIVTRTCAALRPNTVPTQADLDRAAKVMQRKFDQRFPQLAGLRMDYAWAGHLCLTLNDVEIMREIDQGIYAGCVCNGLGTTRSTLTGIGAAEISCGEESVVTRHFAAEAPPKRLPPQPFQELGANAVLRWKEWRAREE